MQIYNTLTRRRETFKLPASREVRMFVCGPTVYDYCHLGHARTYVAFDVIARYMRFRGYPLFFLMNITDVDEKVIKKAKERDVNFLELAREYEEYFLDDLKSLKVECVNAFARASDHIPEIIDQVTRLIRNGFAYETKTGVYFSVQKFHEYGALSNQSREEISLRRIELCSTKRQPEDFSLWRKIDQEPKWNSPWGSGQPGWHIEDTAIAMKFFGPQYDLHGGAVELIFPHHEAEIAQGEALTGLKPYVKHWLHTGILKIGGRKMSKALGNVISIRNILKSNDYKFLRFYLLTKHYRETVNFSTVELKKSKRKLQFIASAIDNFSNLPITGRRFRNVHALLIRDLEKLETMFMNYMDNDFNTSKALNVIQRMAVRLNNFAKRYGEIDESTQTKALGTLRKLADIFGIL